MSSHAKCYLPGTMKNNTTKFPILVKAKAKEEANVDKIRKDVEKLTANTAQTFKEIASECAASRGYMEKLGEMVNDLKVDSVQLKKAKLDVVHDGKTDDGPSKIVKNKTLPGKTIYRYTTTPHLYT